MKTMREATRPLDLCVADTFFGAGASFFSQLGSGSNPDDIWFHHNRLQLVQCFRTSKNAGCRLQLMKDRTKFRIPMIDVVVQERAPAAGAADPTPFCEVGQLGPNHESMANTMR